MSEPKILKLPSRGDKNVCYNYVKSLLEEYSEDITMLNFIYDLIRVVDSIRVSVREIASSDTFVSKSLEDSKKPL